MVKLPRPIPDEVRARQARADLIYLIARADDSPKEMYRKLGFETELGFDVWLRLPR